MFGARRPKIIANYDNDEPEEEPVINRVTTAPKFKSKTRMKVGTKTGGGSSSSRPAVKKNNQDEDDEEDLDSIVIRPNASSSALRKTGLFKTTAKKIPVRKPYIATEPETSSTEAPKVVATEPAIVIHTEDEFAPNADSDVSMEEVEEPDSDKGGRQESVAIAALAGVGGGTDASRRVRFKEDVEVKEVDSSENEADFIALEPEVMAEEKQLLEARIYNEFDMEEGVEMLDEDLALDEKTKMTQEQWRRRLMEEAIDDVANDEDDEDTARWMRNQQHHSVVYANENHDEIKEHKQATKAVVEEKEGEAEDPLPLPSLEDVLKHITASLDKLRGERDTISQEIKTLNEDVSEIEAKQALVQDKLNQAGLNYQVNSAIPQQ